MSSGTPQLTFRAVVLAIAGLGGLLGVLFSVPLRRSMIVEEPLPFPEGKAAAEVLKAGENPGPGLKILADLVDEDHRVAHDHPRERDHAKVGRTG